MIEEQDLYTAYRVAEEEHKGQKYGEHDYFSYHIFGVYSIARSIWGMDNTLLCVAYLHDILEDTSYTGEELYQTFGSEVYYAVSRLTNSGVTSYKEYLEGIYSNPIAAKVKIADATFNMLECAKTGDSKRAAYYLKNIEKLYKHSNLEGN